MKQPKPSAGSHHSLNHLDELSARHLHSFRVSFDADQVAPLRVLWDSHRHFVLLLDPIDCRKERVME